MTTENPQQRLYLSLELGDKNWKLSFFDGQKLRQVNMPAADQEALRQHVTLAKQRLKLPAQTPLYSCYEAGRDGFWIHRLLQREGIENVVVDSASIEVSRRRRHVKTDRLDGRKLVEMLWRYHQQGERRHWRVVRVPSEKQEDARRSHRERERLVRERSQHLTRLRSLLVLHGVRVSDPRHMQPTQLRDWQGQALPAQLTVELQREQQRLALVDQQLGTLEKWQHQRLQKPQTKAERQAQKLTRLRSIGETTGWVLGKELFGWREFDNRRQVGALAGLTGTPYNSGRSQRDQGISKAGNARIRYLAVELAWRWVRLQPESELSQWFWHRFGYGNKRQRRVGIVAVARKLLVALWKYLEHDELPAGAVLKSHS